LVIKLNDRDTPTTVRSVLAKTEGHRTHKQISGIPDVLRHREEAARLGLARHDDNHSAVRQRRQEARSGAGDPVVSPEPSRRVLGAVRGGLHISLEDRYATYQSFCHLVNVPPMAPQLWHLYAG
jgi:hypothetical protein